MKKSFAFLHDEDGQGLVEFAVVLPILLLLTVGTILLTVSYIQKSRMNGLAYMAARVTAVRRDSDFSTRQTLTQYQNRSGQAWVESIRVVPVTADSERQVNVQLTKPGERLDLLANLVSGLPPAERPQDLQVRMSLNPEYRASGPLRPQTYMEVDYRYQTRGELPWEKLPSFITSSIINPAQMADQSSHPSERDKILSLEPPDKALENFYREINWGPLAYAQNEEKEAGRFENMQSLHEHFKSIESGGSLLDLILNFVPFINQLKLIVGDIGEEAARQVERSLGDMSVVLDKQVRETFQNTSPGDEP